MSPASRPSLGMPCPPVPTPAQCCDLPTRCCAPQGAPESFMKLCTSPAQCPGPACGLRRVNTLSGSAPAQGAASLQDHFLPLGLGQAHSDHPHGSEAASGLDYTRAGDVAFSCLCPVALNSTGHLGPNRTVVGKDSASDRAAPGV